MKLHSLQPDLVTSQPAAKRLATPRENGGILCVPTLPEARQSVLSNRMLLESSEIHIGSTPLKQFRNWTRQVVQERARKWMKDVLRINPPVEVDFEAVPLILTGHQPSLNHPGVWMKNVATAHIAKCFQSIGMNLIVDNDIADSSGIRVPSGSRAAPTFETVLYDTPDSAKPWEERVISDRSLLSSFADRVTASMKPWGVTPSLSKSWPAALELSQNSSSVPLLLTAARVADEADWGIHNLEYPVSELCSTEPFLRFLLAIVQQHEAFANAYNSGLEWYRATYKIRSEKHPVPRLEQTVDRCELPFWYWEPGQNERLRLFVRRVNDQIVLLAGEHELATVEVTGDDIAPLIKLQQQGRLRTRALTTTLFTRLCLADLFVHGIGGAKYDEITDKIFELFFGIAPPRFLTVTATVRLPLNGFDVSNADRLRLVKKLSRLKLNGPSSEIAPDTAELIEERNSLINAAREQRSLNLVKTERRKLRIQNRQRHLRLKAIQVQLEELAEAEIAQASSTLEQVENELHCNRVLNNREFPVCLFSHDLLKSVVDEIRAGICHAKNHQG